MFCNDNPLPGLFRRALPRGFRRNPGRLFLFCAAVAVATACHQAQAQQTGQLPKIAVKTNLLYGAGTLTPNLGVELRLGGRMSLDVSAGWNPFTFSDNRKWKHILVQPEMRLWTGEAFSGHFFGLHGHYAFYNVGNLPKPFSQYMRDHRFEGWLAGAGVSYGYRWNFGKDKAASRWGLEATVGVGYAYMKYDKYACGRCGENLGNQTKHYFGPTKVGVSLIYSIGKRKQPAPAPVPEYNPLVVVGKEPEAVVAQQPEPQPEPVVVPQSTTAERLAAAHPFLAPIAELGDGFRTDPERYIGEHRDGSLSVYFRQGAKTIDRSYKDNGATLNELLSAIREIQNSSDSRVVRVIVAGFASPEGDAAANDRLAHERAVTIKGYLVDNTSLTGNMVDIHNGGIDWRGLRRLVAESDMYEKRQVLDIIDNMPVWDARRNVGRLGELMRLNGGEPYRYMLQNFFPELRNATYIRVYYENK